MKKKLSPGATFWVIFAGVLAAGALVLGVMAMNGVFSEDGCPAGKQRIDCALADPSECPCVDDDQGHHRERWTVDKPIIYLYPETSTEVAVTLGHPEKLTASYPAYQDGWRVLAQPNSDLTDLDTGRSLYSLYWEGTDSDFTMTDQGFVVKGSDIAAFLEEKLPLLGLSSHETEEFIIYWLPQLQDNSYNYIRFATSEEINAHMPLNITPEPTTLIRVLMLAQPLDSPIDVEEQQLPATPVRDGFTAVEWGGSIIK